MQSSLDRVSSGRRVGTSQAFMLFQKLGTSISATYLTQKRRDVVDECADAHIRADRELHYTLMISSVRLLGARMDPPGLTAIILN